jgi:hypothetical protein
MMEVAVAVIPMFLELSQEYFVIVHRGIDKRKHPYMPFLTAVALLTAIGEIWFSHNLWQTLSILLGIAGIMAVAIISEFINVPLNRKINAWSSDSASGNLLEVRDKWIQAHYLRTICGAVGFVFLLAPVLTVIQQ